MLGKDAVFAEAKDAARWREPIRNTWVADYGRMLVEKALAEADEPIAWPSFRVYRRFDTDGDRTEHSDAYFGIRKRLFAAAIGVLLSDDVPVSAVEELLWAICDEYVWALPAHIPELSAPEPEIPHDEVIDLFAAETAFALAEITVLLRERLHPLVVARVRREVERRVLTPFRERRWHWESVDNNWSSVCAASVALAAMHLDTEGLDGILARCTAAMDALLSGYGDDGICTEGLNYWTYGFGHFAIYAEALRQRTGEDLWEGPHRAKLAAMLRYSGNVSLGGRAVAAFSDAEPFGTVAPALAGLVESRDPSAAVPRELWSDAGWSHNWGPVIRQFVWARDAADDVPTATASGRWFADAGWLIVRSVEDGIPFGLAAKAGHNDEPHNHNDLGSFVLAVDGEPLLSELGMGYYDGFYFLPESRYRSLSAGSQGHSAPIIGGVRQHAGAGARARVQEVSADHLVVDITTAYAAPGLRSVVREVRFSDGALRIEDAFALDAPVEIIDRFVSLYPIELTDAGALVRGERNALELTWTEGWEPRLSEEEFLDHGGATELAHFLDLVRTSAEARCVLEARVRFTP